MRPRYLPRLADFGVQVGQGAEGTSGEARTGGGAGVDYHSLSRHFSIGLRGEYYLLRDISDSKDLIVTTYLRYTF